ncbi:hypothetical protein Tco_0450556 [Tanacetum coccineum]
MRSLYQFKSTLGSASNTGDMEPFQISFARPPLDSLMLTSDKSVKEQGPAKTDLELADVEGRSRILKRTSVGRAYNSSLLAKYDQLNTNYITISELIHALDEKLQKIRDELKNYITMWNEILKYEEHVDSLKKQLSQLHSSLQEKEQALLEKAEKAVVNSSGEWTIFIGGPMTRLHKAPHLVVEGERTALDYAAACKMRNPEGVKRSGHTLVGREDGEMSLPYVKGTQVPVSNMLKKAEKAISCLPDPGSYLENGRSLTMNVKFNNQKASFYTKDLAAKQKVYIFHSTSGLGCHSEAVRGRDSPKKGRVPMSERFLNPTPITQYNPVTNEVVKESGKEKHDVVVVNEKLDDVNENPNVVKEKPDFVKENPASVKEKPAVMKEALRYSRKVDKEAVVKNKLSLGKCNVPTKLHKDKVDKEVVADKASVQDDPGNSSSVVMSKDKRKGVNDKVLDVVAKDKPKGSVSSVVVMFSITNTTSMTILDNMDSGATYDSKYKQPCDLLKKLFASHLRLYGHERHSKIGRLKARIPKLKWKTKANVKDCGIFTMLHMESYMGQTAKTWDCGLVAESKQQCDMLRQLRLKFATKILLHESNVHTQKMIRYAE